MLNVFRSCRRQLRRAKRKIVVWFVHEFKITVRPPSYDAQSIRNERWYINELLKSYKDWLLICDTYECEKDLLDSMLSRKNKEYVKEINQARDTIRCRGGRPGPCGAILIAEVTISYKLNISRPAARQLAIELYYSSK